MFYVSKLVHRMVYVSNRSDRYYTSEGFNIGIFDELPTSLMGSDVLHSNIIWLVPNEQSIFNIPIFVLERQQPQSLEGKTVVLYANTEQYFTVADWQRGIVAYQKSMIKYIKNPSEELKALYKMLWEL